MSEHLAPAELGGALMSASARVPTGIDRRPTGAPRRAGVRPFGLRFVQSPTATATPPMPAWRLDDETQIAVADDGTPLHRMAGAGSMKTTGPSPDGGPSTGGEEWTPDFLGDDGQ